MNFNQKQITDFWRRAIVIGDCWIYPWTNVNCKPQIWSKDRKLYRVSRVAYTLSHGQIPEGLVICHKCDNPLCYNPSHLFLGTQTDNMRDMYAKGRHPQNKLNWDLVKAIREKRATGITIAKLAEEFDLSNLHVTRIVNNKAWHDATYVPWKRQVSTRP